MPNQPGQPPRTTVQGSIDRVPCPHCGAPNDLRELQSQQLLDTGHKLDCDKCKRIMEVTSIRQVCVVAVRQSNVHGHGHARQPQPQMQQPKPQGLMAGIKGLLGGPKR